MNEINDTVRTIIAEMLTVKLHEVTLEKNIKDDLGADSLDMVELVMEIESKFGIEIPDELSNVKTVSDVITAVQNLLK